MVELVKKHFLRVCMNYSILTADLVNGVLPPICEAYNWPLPATWLDLKQLVNSINEDIKPSGMVLDFVMHAVMQTEYLVFGHTLESYVGCLQEDYSDGDRFFFTWLLTAMASEENYGIEWVRVYEVKKYMPKQRVAFTKKRISDLLDIWMKQGYFSVKDDTLYFGPRMILEFSPVLKRNFPDSIKNCALCEKVVFWDVKCDDCGNKMHRKCIRAYLARNSNCPACKREWNTRLSTE